MTADGRGRVLADGNAIPLIGLGVWQIPNGPECVAAVQWALELGYRHIDTAELYENERGVGQGILAAGLDRSEVYITSKLNNGFHRPDDARPGVFLVLVLRHQPVGHLG